LDASEVGTLLKELGQRTLLAGGNPYRAKAYLKAAENLAAVPLPLTTLISSGGLRQIPGVGETIAAIIEKLHLTGTHPTLEKMRQEVPPGVLDMLTIPGLRPDRALKLYNELGITSVDELEAAVRSKKLKGIRGLGPAFQRKILQGI
jgi:DNA polymerase (family 10)